MAQLAIKGHPTRGKEVIEILEMLGGKSNGNIKGYNDDLYYFIAKDGLIYGSGIEYKELTCNYTIFTLEEFEEKFPYKVGDKVYNIIHNENQTITEVVWDFQEDEIVYQTNNNDYLFVNYLQPYEEENYCQVIGNNTSSNGVNTSASSINEETMVEVFSCGTGVICHDYIVAIHTWNNAGGSKFSLDIVKQVSTIDSFNAFITDYIETELEDGTYLLKR